jgi:hypothetical protein
VSGQYFPGVARIKRRGLIVRLVVLAALLAVLVLMILLWPKAAKGGLQVATVTGTVQAGGVLQGTLVGSRDGDNACYSMTVRGTTSVLQFVDGWSAKQDLGLVDPAGAVVAKPGGSIILLGEPGSIGSVAGCGERGRIWTITSAQLPPTP